MQLPGLGFAGDPAFQHVAHRDTHRRQNVALLPIAVLEQGDVRTPVRIVLDGRHLRGDSVLVRLKSNDAVNLAGSAAAKPRHGLTAVISAAGLAEPHTQALLGPVRRQLRVVVHGARSAPWTRRFVKSNTHTAISF